ncbi:unnamed protein product [Closterium sp. Naga37s-1]|nr:unnamed protein product [Closterium sp. Naga37s-1]
MPPLPCTPFPPICRNSLPHSCFSLTAFSFLFLKSSSPFRIPFFFPSPVPPPPPLCPPLPSPPVFPLSPPPPRSDLAAHIDGFIASAAHTVVVQEDAAAPVTGKAADVIAAANTAAEVALRLWRLGKCVHRMPVSLPTGPVPTCPSIPTNKEVAEALQKVAEAYGVHVVEGVLSHQMKQFVIDANKVVLSVSSPEMRVEDFEFEANEVYAVDIVMSSGEGKPKLVDEKQTMVYKRAVDKAYSLKLKASRAIFSEISQKFSIMPFTARALETKAARLGLVECVNHDLLQPYPVLHEKQGDIVAHIKFTVLLMPNGSDRITSATLQTLQPTSELQDADVKVWLAMSYKTKKKTSSKKKAAKEGEEEAKPAEASA